jgi:glycine/D-amino acid oxidase-like deaminating enzyme
VLIEKARLAHGASGRNAGFLLQGTDADFARTVEQRGVEQARRLWQFTQENRDALVDALAGADVGLEYSGSLTVAGDAAEDDRLRTAADLLRRDGVEAAYLAADVTNRRLGSIGFLGALHVASGVMMHPVRVVHALAAQSRALVVEGCAVRTLETEGDRVRVETDGGAIEAGRVVLALNAYLPTLVPALSGSVRPVRAQMLATAPVEVRLREPVYSHEGYYYLRQLPSGEVLLGGARHRHRAAEVGYDDATTDALQADLEGYLRTHFPDLAGALVVRRWSGTMGFSADGLPAFGPVPGVPRSLWVGGFTGHGMGYGFRMGRLVASELLGQPDPFADLFHARRLERAG